MPPNASRDDAARTPRRLTAGVRAPRTRRQRSFATLLLADLSLNPPTRSRQRCPRVIDVIRRCISRLRRGARRHRRRLRDARLRLGAPPARAHTGTSKGFDAGPGATGTGARGRHQARLLHAHGRGAAPCHQAPRAAARRQRPAHPHRRQSPTTWTSARGRWGLGHPPRRARAREAGLLPASPVDRREARLSLPHLFGRGGWAQCARPARTSARSPRCTLGDPLNSRPRCRLAVIKPQLVARSDTRASPETRSPVEVRTFDLPRYLSVLPLFTDLNRPGWSSSRSAASCGGCRDSDTVFPRQRGLRRVHVTVTGESSCTRAVAGRAEKVIRLVGPGNSFAEAHGVHRQTLYHCTRRRSPETRC